MDKVQIRQQAGTRFPRLPNPLRGGVDKTKNPPKVGLDGRQMPGKEESCGWNAAEDKNNLEFTGIVKVSES